MYFLTYSDNGVKYPLTLYGKLNYLNSLLEENHSRLRNYVDKGNWVLQNQNPIVQFIANMNIDLEWDDEYIFNYIQANYENVASLCNFTTLRNKGENHPHSVFPEKQHDVLITIPFGEPPHPMAYYYEDEAYQNLFPLRTLFTTDIKQRWSITDMTDNGNASTYQNSYTVVQLDPFALVIGYVRYYRDRVKNERLVGLTPNSYVAKYPLANFYLQHNQMVVLNYIWDGVEGMKFDKPKWAMVDYKRWVVDFAETTKNGMARVNPETIDHFIKQSFQVNQHGGATDSLYPYIGLSRSFIQLGWVYAYSGMRLAIAYADYCQWVGKPDSLFKSRANKFIRGDVNSMANQIKDPKWKALYIRMFKELKEKIKY